MSCLKEGFIHKRHDQIRDLLAVAINEVAYDVSTEPALFPLTGEDLPRSANSRDEARVDIAARGFWQRCERHFSMSGFLTLTPRHIDAGTVASTAMNGKRSDNTTSGLSKWSTALSHRSSSAPMVAVETQHFLSFLAEKLAAKKF